jgi:polar amino acid transport system permease protein
MADWDLIVRTLAGGAHTTVVLTLGAAAVGLVVAFATGLLEASRRVPLRALSRCYIEFFRGSSAIVQLFLLFYVVPVLGITLPAMTVAVLALGMNMGAYGSQVVRAGVESVDRGQWEAAVALNLSDRDTLWRVVMPQAVRMMLPSFSNELIELLKLSALASLITLRDVTWSGKMLVQTLGEGRTVDVYLSVLIAYLILALPLVGLLRFFERRRGRGWVQYAGRTSP